MVSIKIPTSQWRAVHFTRKSAVVSEDAVNVSERSAVDWKEVWKDKSRTGLFRQSSTAGLDGSGWK